MYANTAYEALYQLMGLQFQEEVTRWITSQVIFRALILMIFGSAFFLFLLHFAARYIPFFLPMQRAPLSKLILLIFCLFLGISLLKVGAGIDSRGMSGQSWARNTYVLGREPSIRDQYRVSLIFRLLSGSAEEIARSLGFLIDATFAKTNPQMTAPNFLFKAILGAASDTIDDPSIKSSINLYTDECLGKLLPQFDRSEVSFLDQYFSRDSAADRQLAQISIGPSTEYGPSQNCLNLKRSLNQSLSSYARSHSSVLERVITEGSAYDKFRQGFGANYENWVTSNLLVNHYIGQSETSLGLEKGAELPGTGGRIFQYINRTFSMDGILSLFGRRDLKGASVAAARSQELSDHLARAPHVAGFLKMLLIGFFPVLVFFLAAGKWRPVVWWWLTYLSICLWTPIWALLYHVVTHLSLSVETMEAYGRLGDGISLYAASLVSSRLYQAFAVYSYLQLLVGPACSGALLMSVRPLLMDSAADSLPDGISTGTSVAARVVGGLG